MLSLTILFFTRRLTVGGCQINAINLATALVRRGHKVVFLAGGGPLEEQVLSAGMELVRTNYTDRKHPSFRTMRELADLVKHHKADIVQAFDPIPLLEAYGSQLWHKQPVYGLAAAQSTPCFRLPKSREIALVNPDTMKRYIQLLGWSPERLRLIVARLDCQRYRPLNVSASQVFGKYGVSGNVPVVTLITRVDQGKWATIGLFLSAAQHWFQTRFQVRPVQFVIVGGGPLFLGLQEHAQSLENEGIIFTTGELLDIPEVMNASAIILGMASTCQQGLACGRPVIVLGKRGFSATVDSDNFEFLAAHHFNLHRQEAGEQPESLCLQIGEILDSTTRTQRLSAFGRDIACERFDSQIGARQLEEVYSSLLEKRSPQPAKQLEIWVDYALSLASLYLYRLRRRLRYVNH